MVKVHRHWGRIAAYDDPAGWARRVLINKHRSRLRLLSTEATTLLHVKATTTLPHRCSPGTGPHVRAGPAAAGAAGLRSHRRRAQQPQRPWPLPHPDGDDYYVYIDSSPYAGWAVAHNLSTGAKSQLLRSQLLDRTNASANRSLSRVYFNSDSGSCGIAPRSSGSTYRI